MTKEIRISSIAAMSRNHVIGVNNKMPWHIPAEFKYFKEKTYGKPVIMGRKSYEALGKPLPGRANIIISRNPEQVEGDVFAVDTLDKAIERAKAIAAADGKDEIFITGGGQIYRDSLPVTDRLYLTIIDRDYEGDAFFPELDMTQWKEISSQPVENDPPYTFKIFERV